MFEDYYEILEISRNASLEIIEKSYIVLAKKYHSDRNMYGDYNICNEKMKKINEAYNTLKDPAKRENYNRIYDEMRFQKNSYANYKVNDNKNNNKNSDSSTSYGNNTNYGGEGKKKAVFRLKKFKFTKKKLAILMLVIIAYIAFDYQFTRYQDNLYARDYQRIEELNKEIKHKNESVDNLKDNINFTKAEMEKEMNRIKNVGDRDKQIHINDWKNLNPNMGSTTQYNEMLDLCNKKVEMLNEVTKERNDMLGEASNLRVKVGRRITLFPNFSRFHINEIDTAFAAENNAIANNSKNKNTTVYVTSNGEKYHKAGCSYLEKSCMSIDINDAKQKGYEPCSKCNPPR